MHLFRQIALLFAPAVLLIQHPDSVGVQPPFHPPPGVVVAGLRETATHRGSLPVLRVVSGHQRAVASFWVHLDTTGRAIEIRDIKAPAYLNARFDQDAIFKAVREVRYAPFTRNEKPIEAWTQDRIQLFPQEDKSHVLDSRQESFPEPNPSTNFSITLSRSSCYGWCPEYSVTIYGDGTVKYEGKRFVSIDGEHTSKIARDAALELLKRFREADFFNLKNKYHAVEIDSPTYRLELATGARKKVISDNVGEWVGMPAVVTELEEAVDQTADSARWVTASPQTVEAIHDAGISLSSNQAMVILHRAVECGNPDAVRSLLAAGVPTVRQSNANEVGKWNPSGSLLDVAFYRDLKSRKAVIKVLLKDPAIRADSQNIQMALGKAAASGQPEIARMLIAAGADPQALFSQESYNPVEKSAERTYLMRAVESGVWTMIDDALSRPHDIHAVDHDGRSAVAVLIWTSPPEEDIFPVVDRLVAAGAGRKELDRALADACDRAEWRDGLIARGANPQICVKFDK